MNLPKDQNLNETLGASSEPRTPVLVTRSLFGGLLMGLANLVPGISGGTMLLAAGVYPAFIKSIGGKLPDLSFDSGRSWYWRASWRPLDWESCVSRVRSKNLWFISAWVMYSLFIGLTLGGLPLVWRMARPATGGMIVASDSFVFGNGRSYFAASLRICRLRGIQCNHVVVRGTRGCKCDDLARAFRKLSPDSYGPIRSDSVFD